MRSRFRCYPSSVVRHSSCGQRDVCWENFCREKYSTGKPLWLPPRSPVGFLSLRARGSGIAEAGNRGRKKGIASGKAPDKTPEESFRKEMFLHTCTFASPSTSHREQRVVFAAFNSIPCFQTSSSARER